MSSRLSRLTRSSARGLGIRLYTSGVSGNPKPFLGSKAHKFRIRDEYTMDKEQERRGRFAIPLGLGLFAFIMYMGYGRTYGETDAAIYDYLHRDISDKVPPPKMQKIRSQLEEEERLISGKKE